jgi:membrane protein YqaA with SNARE-associated domain
MDDSVVSSDPALTRPTCAVRPQIVAPRGLRLWFGAFLVWMVGLFAIALLMFGRYEAGDTAALGLWILALTGFYVSLCNSLLPLPTAWIILLAASDDVRLFDSAALRIAAVAVLGGTATMIANLNEYHLLRYLFRARLGARLRGTRAYRWAVRWFDAAPLQTLTLFAFLPIPVDVVRWLAILRGYSRLRFAIAYWLGRTPRYALLAGLAVAVHLGAWEIALIQVAIILLLGARLIWTAHQRITGAAGSTPSSGVREQTPSA